MYSIYKCTHPTRTVEECSTHRDTHARCQAERVGAACFCPLPIGRPDWSALQATKGCDRLDWGRTCISERGRGLDGRCHTIIFFPFFFRLFSSSFLFSSFLLLYFFLFLFLFSGGGQWQIPTTRVSQKEKVCLSILSVFSGESSAALIVPMGGDFGLRFGSGLCVEYLCICSMQNCPRPRQIDQ